MSQYKTRATKRDDGGYDLSYGKGNKKITATTHKDPSNSKWFVDTLGHFKKLGELKKAWGTWASEQYYGTSKAVGETVPSCPAHIPPPPTIPPPPPAVKRKPKGNGLTPPPPVGRDGLLRYAFDPFDPQFRYPADHETEAKRKAVTPLGMLLEIQAWHERYKDRVEQVNHRLAQECVPGFNPFSFLRMMIDECIEREVPPTEENDDVAS